MTQTKNPGTQRLRVYEADQQARYAMMGSHLSKELRTAHKTRNLPIRVGDTAKVMRGDWKGKSGEVTQVDYVRNRVFVKGFTHKRATGKEAFIGFRPSNLMITALEGKEKRRTVKGKAATKKQATKTAAPTKAAGKKE
jgi:large subunit ribosomal protein L24